ncbi:BREX system P-loop protein BrxC [candidate division KSB1 bacterium]|nr:BREX system P-loop protein BrxC [candidate division KSB1 bacterium]
MKTIGDLLARDLSQRIEEIIQVDQTDEQSVYTELTEYVATDRIKDQYRQLLRAIAEAPTDPHEGIGVWISGFFGSGKSSFAKNLGYVLANREVLGQQAGNLFKAQLDDHNISALLESINARIPTEVVMFDVSKDRAVRRATERIAEIMYTVLLRELDYAEDYDVAELEIELEKEGRLDDFIRRCQQLHGLEWRMVRKGAQKISRASAVLNALDPATYSTPESWALSLRDKSADITVSKFVERTFELCARRRPGKGLVFIIDEVGQYVARSADKIEDLRAVVEQFGKVSKNLLKARKAVAPVWIVVTSQEKLDEVVAALDSRRVELAKLQDRFRHRIDLSPADIREVATKRVLAKKDEAVPILQKLFAESQGQLNMACRLERTSRRSEITDTDFVQFYPYLPHFIELSIDIMSGIRLQPGALRHLGGSNRTIIKQAHEMLISERTALAGKPIGTLVTLDKIFELVEGNLSTERQRDIYEISQRFDSEDRGLATRVAKVVCLLEFVRDLPRTEANIAACLVDAVGELAPLAEVQRALKKLQEAQFVKSTEDGWKLQTAQEKNWETEKRAIDTRTRDRHEIVRDALNEIFNDSKLRTYRYGDLRSFAVSVTVDGVRVSDEGKIPLCLAIADTEDSFQEKLEATCIESRQEAHKNEIYWVFALTSEVDDLVASLHASRQMVAKYSQLQNQNRINKDDAACLADEKNEGFKLQGRLREKLIATIETGQGVFQGVPKDAAALGRNLGEIFKKLFDYAVPSLYPKLEMGNRPLKGTEAEEILKAANLNALSQVFYEGEQGLHLVIKEGSKFVLNPSAEIAREILDFMKREHAYGNRVTGKNLEEHFQGIGYGWDRDVLRVVLAALLRAGVIEVTHQGRRYRNHQDPQCRVPFTNIPAFRAASFAPREAIDLKTLTTAVRYFEELAGEEVDVEESAIAAAFQKLADAEQRALLPVAAIARANLLPIQETLEAYQQTLNGVLTAATDDRVRILAGEGKSFKEARDRIQNIRKALTDSGLDTIRQARTAKDQLWPILAARGQYGELRQKAEQLGAFVNSEAFFEQLEQIKKLSRELVSTYHSEYTKLHHERAQAFAKAIEELKGRVEWNQLDEDMRGPVLAPLLVRACEPLDLPVGATQCRRCQASLGQIESDLAALPSLKSQVLARLQELTAPVATRDGRIERVKLSEFFKETLDSEQAVDEALERLREHLLKLIAERARIIIE